MTSATNPSTSPRGQTSGPRGRYAKSEEVQKRIVNAAAEVFSSMGFNAGTFKEIARRAGVSERGLAYHFPTKEELLEAVMNAHHQRRSAIVLSSSGLSSFAAVIAVVEADAQLPDVVGLQSILIGEATSVDHPAHDHYRLRYADLRTYLGDAFSEALRTGHAASELAAEELAAGLIALLDGLQLQWLYARDSVRVARTVEGYLASILTVDAMVLVRRLKTHFVAESAKLLTSEEPRTSA